MRVVELAQHEKTGGASPITHPSVQSFSRSGMLAELRPSFLRAAPTALQGSVKIPLVPYLALILLLPNVIVIGNCILGVIPITTVV
jgi:hypothetical protein